MPYKDPEKQKQYDKEKYRKNREHILEYRRLYYRDNWEAINAKNLERQRKRRDEYNAYHRDYRRNKRTDAQKRRDTEKAKEWRKNNGNRVYQTVKRYQQRNPHKAFAQIVVNAAIRLGLLIRPDRCSICNKVCKPHAHHTDYTKVLEVVWACSQCHVAIHRETMCLVMR